MKKQALLDFAAFLRNLEIGPNDKFCMGTWKANYISPREGCGTSACAIGWGMTKGVLPGLEWGERGMMHPYQEPWYNDLYNFRAIEAYFGLEPCAGDFLFGPEDEHGDDRDETPIDVADRIEAYVANPILPEGFKPHDIS